MPERQIFDGVRECSSATGIPLDVLLSAKSHPDCPRSNEGGFSDGRKIIITDTFRKWLEDHKEELENIAGTDREYWLTRSAKAKALLLEMELSEAHERVVNKESVKDLLGRIAAAQVSLFNSKLRQELPGRLNLPADKVAEIDKVLAELFAVMQKGLEKWK